MASRTIAPRPGRVRLALRRAAAHLTRSSARWGYIVFVLCILVYAFIPESWDIAGTVREFFLILASVAVGAIVLPELPSNLWSIDVTRVRNLIPDSQRQTLARSLIAAESDDSRWTDLVWSKALEPLSTASRNPWEYTVDMDYDVDVYPDRSLKIGETVIPVHSVAVNQKSFRVLSKPGISSVWLTIARTSSALNREFLEPACLARELVPLGDLEGAAWQDAVLSSCQVELFIDGIPIELVAEAVSELPDVVRWRLPAQFELTTDRVRVHIRFDFHIAPEIESFPVMFSGYYCAGITDISMRLYDEKQQTELECDYFVGRALDQNSTAGTTESGNGVYKQITFSTGKDSILWPGSGVMFRWRSAA